MRPNVDLSKQICISPSEANVAGRVARWIQTNYPEPENAGWDEPFASIGIVYVDFPKAAEKLAANLQKTHGLISTFITGDMDDEVKMERLNSIFDRDKWGFKVCFWWGISPSSHTTHAPPSYQRILVRRATLTPTRSHHSAQVIVATDAFGLGVDVPNLKFVIQASMPSSIDNNVQKGGRCGRGVGERGSSHQLIVPQRIARQYVLMCENQPEELERFNESVKQSLDFIHCDQAALGLWPSAVSKRMEAMDCGGRCGQCMRGDAVDQGASGYVVDVHGLARQLVGSGVPTDMGTVGDMRRRGEACTFRSVTKQYLAEHLHDEDCVPNDYVPSALLLVIAHNFLGPSKNLSKNSRAEDVLFLPAPYLLLKELFAKPEVTWWLPDLR